LYKLFRIKLGVDFSGVFKGLTGELGLFKLNGNIVEEFEGVVTLELELSLESLRVLFFLPLGRLETGLVVVLVRCSCIFGEPSEYVRPLIGLFWFEFRICVIFSVQLGAIQAGLTVVTSTQRHFHITFIALVRVASNSVLAVHVEVI